MMLVGKFVAAYLPLIREKEYYIACACEEIYAPPSASVALFGFTVEGTFVRGMPIMLLLAYF
jgi:protease-4